MRMVRLPGSDLSQRWAPRIPGRREQRTELSLPFRGVWLTFWGGDTRELSHHHDVPAQTFAFDFVGVGPDGKTRKGQSVAIEDYYAFGRDDTPGSMNSYMLMANVVFIDHSSGDVSVLAHLKHGSVTVKQGDHVRQGQVIGLCGNSGNSSEPTCITSCRTRR
jgi:Peptidase family M23